MQVFLGSNSSLSPVSIIGKSSQIPLDAFIFSTTIPTRMKGKELHWRTKVNFPHGNRLAAITDLQRGAPFGALMCDGGARLKLCTHFMREGGDRLRGERGREGHRRRASLRHGDRPDDTKNQSGRIIIKRGQGATALTKPQALTAQANNGRVCPRPRASGNLEVPALLRNRLKLTVSAFYPRKMQRHKGATRGQLLTEATRAPPRSAPIKQD